MDQFLLETKNRMNKTIISLKDELAKLRTGRASVLFLDKIIIDIYGEHVSLSQISTVAVINNRMLSVRVWDSNNIKIVEKAIRESDLGLNPYLDSLLIYVPMPDLTEETRNKLYKIASKYAEQSRVSLRNIRRDSISIIKQQEKNNLISQDKRMFFKDEVQKLTDQFIKSIDKLVKIKHIDIMKI